MCGRVCVCVWQPTPRMADVTVTKTADMLCSRPHSHESVIFGIFGIHTTATLLNICMQ